MCQSFFFNKDTGLWTSALLKKRLRDSCFLVNFVELFRAPFLQTQTYKGMKYCQFSEAGTYFKVGVLKYFQNSQNNACEVASSLIQLQI